MRYSQGRRNSSFQWIDAVPGLPRDTYVHYGGPQFIEERRHLHDLIQDHLLEHCASASQRKAIMMMGGPASGKSSALRALHTEGFTHLDSDAIKAMLPEYKMAVSEKAKNAAAMVHEESAFLVDVATDEAIRRGCNIVYDGTGKNAAKYAKLMAKLQANGYSVHLMYVHVDPAIALPRAIKRAEKTGRYVPEYVIEQAYASIPFNFGTLANHADSWTMFDTTEPPAAVIASKQPGQSVVVHDQERLNSFLTRFPQTNSLRINPRVRRSTVRVNPERVVDALNRYLRSSEDDGDTGLSD